MAFFLGLGGLCLFLACNASWVAQQPSRDTGPTVIATTVTMAPSHMLGTGGALNGGGAGIAGTCQGETDCAAGLLCLNETSDDAVFGGGPAGGFCTRECRDDRDCPAPDGVCLRQGAGPSGYCTLACIAGPELHGSDSLSRGPDPGKCLGRQDLRCDTFRSRAGRCLPTCGAEAQCPPGRACDPLLSVCVQRPNQGLPTGVACDPLADGSGCAGRCVGFDSGLGMCSSPCVLGHAADCGGLSQGLCAFHAKGHGVGDIGFCTPSCTVHSDCYLSGFGCFSIPSLGAGNPWGYCFAAMPCPDDPSRCSDGLQCQDTPLGPRCLDPTFAPAPAPATMPR